MKHLITKEKISKKESITPYQEKPTEQEVEENKAASSILKLIIGGGKFKEGTMDIYIDGNLFSRIPIDKYVNLTKDFEISSGQHVVYLAIYNKKGNLVLKGQEIQNFHKGGN